MADTWGGSWGTPSAWGNSWGVSAVTTPAVGGVHRGRRHRYHIRAKPERLTDDQLDALLTDLLDAPAQQPSRQALKAVPADEAPLQRAVPNYAALRMTLAKRQEAEAVERLRIIAARMARQQDDADVEMLLLWG